MFAVRDDRFAGGREDVMPVGDVRRALMCVALYARAQRELFLYLFPYQSFNSYFYFHSHEFPFGLRPGEWDMGGGS